MSQQPADTAPVASATSPEDSSPGQAAASRRAELLQLSILLVLVALFYFWLIPAGINDPAGFVLDEGLPPSFSARLVAVLAAIILLTRLVRLLAGRTEGRRSESPQPGQPGAPAVRPPGGEATIIDEAPVRLSGRVWAGVAIALSFSMLFIETLGFVVASLVTLALMLWVLGERSRVRLLLLPVLVTGGVWLLFTQLLSVRLPPSALLTVLAG